VVVRHCELIFCFLTRLKCDLKEVEKPIIEIGEWHFEVIFCFLTNRKCEIAEIEKAMFQGLAFHFNLFSASGPAQIATRVNSKK